MQTAKQKRALGLFNIYPDPLANPNGDWIQGFTPARISETVADQIQSKMAFRVRADREKKGDVSLGNTLSTRFRLISNNFDDRVLPGETSPFMFNG